MIELTLKVETESPVLLSSGEGWSTVVDTDLEYDSFGLPYFPAKRLKGLLRESLEEVEEMFQQAQIPWFSETDLDHCFGVCGDTGASLVSFHNLRLPEYSKTTAWLKWAFDRFSGVLSAQQVLDTLTEIRAQTEITDDGIAKDNSLRTCRVLKAGQLLEGKIIIHDDEGEHITHLLALACLNLRYVGSKRNRGFGRVKCSLWQDNQELTKEIIKNLKGV